MQATINGNQIAYDDTGSGQAIVFVHGFPLNRTLWDPQRSALSSQFRIITLDLRGHGESGAAPGPYSMDEFAKDVNGLLQHLGIETAVIAGLSMGGYVTYAYYRLFPETVRGLIFANTKATGDTPEAAAGRRELAPRVLAKGAGEAASVMHPKMFADGVTPPDLGDFVLKMMMGTPPETIADDLLALAVRPDSTPTLRSVRVPALVIHGDRDVLIPPAEAEYQVERLPKGTLHMIAGAGHLSNLENPDAFNGAIASFVAGLA